MAAYAARKEETKRNYNVELDAIIALLSIADFISVTDLEIADMCVLVAACAI